MHADEPSQNPANVSQGGRPTWETWNLSPLFSQRPDGPSLRKSPVATLALETLYSNTVLALHTGIAIQNFPPGWGGFWCGRDLPWSLSFQPETALFTSRSLKLRCCYNCYKRVERQGLTLGWITCSMLVPRHSSIEIEPWSRWMRTRCARYYDEDLLPCHVILGTAPEYTCGWIVARFTKCTTVTRHRVASDNIRWRCKIDHDVRYPSRVGTSIYKGPFPTELWRLGGSDRSDSVFGLGMDLPFRRAFVPSVALKQLQPQTKRPRCDVWFWRQGLVMGREMDSKYYDIRTP